MVNRRKFKSKKRKRTVIRKKRGRGKKIRSRNRYGVGGSSPRSRFDTGGSANLSFQAAPLAPRVSMKGEPRSRFDLTPPPPQLTSASLGPSLPPPEPEPEQAVPTTAEKQLRRSLGLGPRSMVPTPEFTMGPVTPAKMKSPARQKTGKKVARRAASPSRPPSVRELRKSQNKARVQASKDSKAAARATEADRLREAQKLSAGMFWSQVPGGAAAKGAADWDLAHHAGRKPSKSEQQKMRTTFRERAKGDASGARKLMDNK
jgi:hypothetical protein